MKRQTVETFKLFDDELTGCVVLTIGCICLCWMAVLVTVDFWLFWCLMLYAGDDIVINGEKPSEKHFQFSQFSR